MSTEQRSRHPSYKGQRHAVNVRYPEHIYQQLERLRCQRGFASVTDLVMYSSLEHLGLDVPEYVDVPERLREQRLAS